MKILVVRFGAIGDIVMTTGIVRMLKKQLGAEIHYITRTRYEDLLLHNPYIDKLWTVQKDTRPVIERLKENDYDVVIDLHLNLRSRRLCWHLGRRTITYDKMTMRKWLFLWAGIDLLQGKHVVARYLEALTSLGIRNDHLGLDVFFDKKDFFSINGGTKNTVAIVMGGTYPTKRIPANLADRLTQDNSLYFVILGGNDVKDVAIRKRSNVEDLRNRLSLGQSSSVLSQVDVVVSGDTGLLHIAAAYDKPVVVLWGSTDELFGMAPLLRASSHYRPVRNTELACQPCSKYGRSKCPKGHMACLNGLSPSLVLGQIHDLLAKSS